MLCRNFSGGRLPPGIHLGNNALVPGIFSEQFVAHESQCIPIPDEMSDDAAVLSDPFSVSLHSISRWPPREGRPVLVYGLGTLGLAAVAGLRALFPESPVYAIGRYPKQEALARQFGAAEVLTGTPNELIEGVAKLTGANVLRPWSGVPWLLDGVDVVYDTVGTPETVAASLRFVCAQGYVVVSGVEMPARFEWTPLYFKEVNLVGSNAFGVETFRGERMHAFEAYHRLVNEGLDVTPMITHRFPLSHWKDAVMAVAHRDRTQSVKVLLTPS
jgi:threonine dehydrogenase-like Zn-dependent dehydrogenase